MSTNINYVKVKKKNKVEKCNICGTMSEMSWDHVPPKKSIFYPDVELRSLFSKYETGNVPKLFQQNGTRFRTICANCNNNLGTKYDTYFNDFIKGFTYDISRKFEIENEASAFANPTKIIKALFGHLLAAKYDYENTTMDQSMRSFLLDDSNSIPDLNVYYWFFPYMHIEMLRDFSRCDLGPSKNVDFFSMLKMYPLGFYITFDNTYPQLPNLRDYCLQSPDQNIDIRLNIAISELRSSDWPILVDDSTILMGGQSANSAIVSIPRVLKKE